jgi:hypothetical protein
MATEKPTAEASEPDASAWSIGSRSGELCAAAVIILTGLFFVWQSASLKFGGIEQPGPGFFPLLLGGVLCVLAALVALDQLRQQDGERIAIGHRDVAIAFAVLLAVPILFERLGAYATLGSLMAALLILVGRVSAIIAVLAAGAAVVAVWGFFTVLLGVQLPSGMF